MAKYDPELRAHKDWLGLLQPVGLVVSPPALVKAQAVPSQNVAELQQRLLSVVEHPPASEPVTDEPALTNLPAFFRTVLGWSLDDIAGASGGPPLPDGLELVLPDFNETLRPTCVAVDSMGDGGPLMLVNVVSRSTALDETPDDDARTGWFASPQAKLERLLREVKVPVGLLCNGDAVRLVYAPSGESSGHLTFPVAAMCEVSGRPILAALDMLLSEHRVFSAPDGRRLGNILSESRRYQAEVSNALSDQVLGALWELLRGFQASDPEEGRRNFDETAREDPQHIYGGLLAVLMRLIFVLYAEDEGLMPKGEVYANNYSVSGLYDRLRSDAGRYPDTMDQRYGAYAWLLSLFQLIFDGGGHAGLRLPTRHGQLFNPDEFPFLEGRPSGVGRVVGEKFEAPRVADGCIHRVLDALLVLDGERLSYRALDVEQVGSVYEAMMGYEVERASGRSIAVRPKHVVVDVDALLEVDGAKRVKWLKDQADSELTGASATTLKTAATPEEVVAALGRRVSPRSLDATGTPRLMPPGTLYLQPGEERRRTGSHYTPRELTEPIVRTTLRPVLEALGERPTPEQILNLKVCDPAMGSGAFLVESCRQLAERIVTAWEVHGTMPEMPPDEEPLLHARRLVAQQCLYGVDKNPFAVSLAKLSLWLVTLARDHAFTFIDHALKHGDSLVGLTRKQIAAFHWKTKASEQIDWIAEQTRQDIEDALGWRNTLQGFGEGSYNQKKEAWWEAENALADARLIGDLAVAAFFGANKDKARKELRNQYHSDVEAWRTDAVNRRVLGGIVEELRSCEKPLLPMHWEIEFPEVFEREKPGFDAIVGNPPFAGKNTVSGSNMTGYPDWLKQIHAESHGNADLVAHFFRRAFDLARDGGAFGLIATNTIGQGDTRSTGLRWICRHGGEIFNTRKRVKWPGLAAVVVSVVHVTKGPFAGARRLDGRDVPTVTAFLFHRGGHDDPARLAANAGQSFVGSYVLGMGFTFDDTNKKGVATPLAEMRRLIERDPRNREVIFPYIGGEELNTSPTHKHHRYVINFWDFPLRREGVEGHDPVNGDIVASRDRLAQPVASWAGATEGQRRTWLQQGRVPFDYPEPVAADWPNLLAIVEEKAKPERDAQNRTALRQRWWQYAEKRPGLYSAIAGLERVLIICRHQPQWGTSFLSAASVFAESLIVFPLPTHAAFSALQSRPHEIWARFFGSSMKDDLRYTPSDCFETFPFPNECDIHPALEAAGQTYYDFRAQLMVEHDEGLTKTYNRFHDPNETDPDIQKLRELHAAIDRAVVDAYGWTDIPTDCKFLLDYEIDEETWGKKKKPYRYRWPEAIHDEVLTRLLDLNQRRYAEEVAAGLHADKGTKGSASGKKTRRQAARPSSNVALPLD